MRKETATPPEPQAGELLLHITDATVAYTEGPAVLFGASLEVRRGDAVLLIGPSGCGKSTLAMLAAGLIPGTVEASVQGEVWRAPSLERSGGVGYVFQDPEAQLCQLTVGREIAFGLENMGIPPAEMPLRIGTALHDAGLGVDPEEFDTVLSGGMKQKLAIASAIALRPDLLVLDEPTANLDPRATAAVFAQIARLRAQGQTLLVIEHKFSGLLQALDRVVALGPGGREAFSGPLPATVLERWEEMQELGVVPPWEHSPSREGIRYAMRAPIKADASDAFRAEGLGYTYAGFALRRRLRRRGEQPRYAFRGLHFAIPRGGLTAIVGENGSGKSTLLRVLAGFDPPSEGSIARPAAKGAIAFAFQNPEHQFVYETVAEDLLSRYLGDGPVPEDVLALLAEFGLEGHERQSPFALSQGQKRRLSVAAMLLQDHEAYLLDEPTFGQDARTQETIMQRLLALQETGRTVVVTTHDMDLVQRYATQVLVLSEGNLLFAGSPADLFSRQDVLSAAHLTAEAPWGRADAAERGAGNDGAAARFVRLAPEQVLSPIGRLHPAMKLIATFLAMFVLVFTVNVRQGVYLTLLPLALLLFGARLTLRQTAVRLLPFVAFFALYTWTLTAYAQVPPGTPYIRFLFFRLSLFGLQAGLSLGFRMLATVVFAVLFVSTTDLTDLLSSLSQNFKVRPKFAYGTLAGLRFFPLFEEEWAKLRRARALRQRDGRSQLARVVTYALPLLSQAIRLGERVAIAMEARGFRGAAAERAQARSYYRTLRVGARDVLYVIALTGASVLLLLLGR
ncbi:MAG: ATP-binding cassette domain-containing protein [Thermaerobacter sp.]|nr:ATP-binding cassette domain-containing protein [Thermaerobacter sp.]